MGSARFELRTVADDLAARYRAEGWWAGTTLGAVVESGLAALHDEAFVVHSQFRPWRGTFAELDARARALAGWFLAHDVGPGDVVVLEAGRLYGCNVGDSPVFLWRRGRLLPLAQAHALVVGRALVHLPGDDHRPRGIASPRLGRDVGARRGVEAGEAELQGLVDGLVESQVRAASLLIGADLVIAAADQAHGQEEGAGDDAHDTREG